jgi:putative sterol carrier protein
MKELPANFLNIKDLVIELAPSIAKKISASMGFDKDLKGTELSIVLEIDDEKFSCVIKDGSDFVIKESDLKSPTVRVRIGSDIIKGMMSTMTLETLLDMAIGLQSNLSKDKYNVLKSLKGKFLAELSDDEGNVYKIDTILNNTTEPNAVFKLKAVDIFALFSKETNPVNLFMSGAMKIEGDMAFAMSTQPLFS